MPQRTRMVYQEDTRTQKEKDREIKEWVQAHRTDYRQMQAIDSMPPEGPGGSYGGVDSGDGGHKRNWGNTILKVIALVAGFCIVGWLLKSL